MKRRTLLTATLVVALILPITSLYITPASACRKKAEIWKEFVDDP